MRNLNGEFLEEYKLLDKLCREMYGGEKGVTAYIEDMRGTPNYESRHVEGWNEILQVLTRMRHLRNQLTHDVGTMNSAICTPAQIKWLSAFRTAIFDRRDPLAKLQKLKRSRQAAQLRSSKTVAGPLAKDLPRRKEQKRRVSYERIAIAVAIVVTLALLIAFLATLPLG